MYNGAPNNYVRRVGGMCRSVLEPMEAEASGSKGGDRRVSQRKRQVTEGLRRVDNDTRKLVRAAPPLPLRVCASRAPHTWGGGAAIRGFLSEASARILDAALPSLWRAALLEASLSAPSSPPLSPAGTRTVAGDGRHGRAGGCGATGGARERPRTPAGGRRQQRRVRGFVRRGERYVRVLFSDAKRSALARGNREWSLDDGQFPHFRGVRVPVEYGLQSPRRKPTGVAKPPREPSPTRNRYTK